MRLTLYGSMPNFLRFNALLTPQIEIFQFRSCQRGGMRSIHIFFLLMQQPNYTQKGLLWNKVICHSVAGDQGKYSHPTPSIGEFKTRTIFATDTLIIGVI